MKGTGPLYLRMAVRNVRRNPRRSLLTLAAIGFGLLCLIVFQALKVGLHREMVAGTVSLETGALQIHAAGYEANLTNLRPIPHPERVAAALAREALPFASRLKAPAMLLAGPHSSTVLMTGIDPQAEPRVTDLHRRLEAGGYPEGGDGILLGASLAQALGVGPGEPVTLMAQGLFGSPVTRSFPVAGIYRTELESFDRSRVYLPLSDAQDFLRAEGLLTEFVVRAPAEAASATAGNLRKELPAQEYQTRSWEELSPDLVQLIELNDATMNLLILIVFFIVALGIANTMTMVIFERFRELGVLAAIGMPPGGILVLVALESLFLGVLAAGCGTLTGIGACAWLAEHGLDLTRFTSANQYFATSHVIRAHLLPKDLVLANLVTLATAFLAGFFPAWKASRLNPVDAMRRQ